MTGDLWRDDESSPHRSPADDPFALFKSRARWGLPIITLLPAVPYVVFGLVSVFAGKFEWDLAVPVVLAAAAIALTVLGIIRRNLLMCAVSCVLMWGGMALYVLLPEYLN